MGKKNFLLKYHITSGKHVKTLMADCQEMRSEDTRETFVHVFPSSEEGVYMCQLEGCTDTLAIRCILDFEGGEHFGESLHFRGDVLFHRGVMTLPLEHPRKGLQHLPCPAGFVQQISQKGDILFS